LPAHGHGLPRARTPHPREERAAGAPRGREGRRVGDGLMSDAKQIGLPPPKDAPAPRPRGDMLMRAHLLNLIGVDPPRSNLGLLVVAKPARRWFGLGAGLVCLAAAGYSWWKDVAWLGRTAVFVYFALVAVGWYRPLWVEKIGDAWAAFGTALGKVMSYPIFTV